MKFVKIMVNFVKISLGFLSPTHHKLQTSDQVGLNKESVCTQDTNLNQLIVQLQIYGSHYFP